MRDIADGVDDVYGNADDNGVYTSGSLTELVDLFNGTGGNLVDVDHVDLTMPDGTVIANVAVSGLGTFSAPAWAILPGANTFTATAYGNDGSVDSVSWTLYGCQDPIIPEPASVIVWSLLGGLGLIFAWRRRR